MVGIMVRISIETTKRDPFCPFLMMGMYSVLQYAQQLGNPICNDIGIIFGPVSTLLMVTSLFDLKEIRLDSIKHLIIT